MVWKIDTDSDAVRVTMNQTSRSTRQVLERMLIKTAKTEASSFNKMCNCMFINKNCFYEANQF